MLSRSPTATWLGDHRQMWARKPSLRAVYTRWFDALAAAAPAGAPVVELGCGAGLLKQRHPRVIATDAIANPYADGVIDAGALPFADASVGAFVMLDVFHHLPDPARFLREAARALQPGGRVAMVEPWVGLAGRLFYRYVHHEACDCGVDPAQPWRAADKDAMEGNVALPYLYFREGGALAGLDLPLRVVARRAFSALPWLLSGGFQPLSLLPAGSVGAVQAVDRVLSLVPALTATRCAITLQRQA